MAKYNITPEEMKELERISKGLPEEITQVDTEARLKTCSQCNSAKTRIRKSKTPSGLTKYYDEKGKPWRGRKCPACWKLERRIQMRELRGTKNPRV